MPSNWSKGFTKETHPSVRKISDTMKKKKIDNFASWRNRMKKLGKIPSCYPIFGESGDLAELMGVVLGDGHLSRFPRTEELTIFSNSNNRGFIVRYGNLLEKIFNKKPYIAKTSWSNCVRIRIYQKEIKKRLGIPYSPRGKRTIKIPGWILKNEQYIVRYLRGLYEAEGSFCIHKPTGTYKFLFRNRNRSMLRNVFRLMKKIGFHPHVSSEQVQISKKAEVYKAMELLQFRKY